MEDKELFELCRDVYEKTKWYDTKEHYWNNSPPEVLNKQAYDFGKTYEACIPLYTSDYILDKLPPAIWEEVSGQGQTVCLLTLNMQGNGEAIAVYTVPYDTEFRGSHQQRADTPLKALLKLVIALDKTDQLRKES